MTETLTPVRPGKLLINGEAVDAASGRTYTTFNPATEEPICAVAEAGRRRGSATIASRTRSVTERSRELRVPLTPP